MRIWNQWVAEVHTERHAGSSRPPMTNAQEDRHIVKLAMQNRTSTSETITQKKRYSFVIENIWSWVAERLSCHPSPANTIDEVWHGNEKAWNELPASDIQSQFDSMPNWLCQGVPSSTVEQLLHPNKQTGGGDIMLWRTFSWMVLRLLILTGETLNVVDYLSVIAEELHPYMASFPTKNGIFQQDSVPCQKARIVLKGFKEHKDGYRFNSCQVIYSQFGLAIHQNDHQARRRFVEWAQNEIAVVPDFHKRILFSDEAHFWLNGYVNKQNCRIWSEANPQVYVETSLHPEKLIVWCALWAGGILLQKR
ncbi:uncharacterized protein TNCV_3196891 [Trichonephila clavipes]|nr:uncharacterized protein TNCV_3196891 [Trichonephila clavipes]